MLAFLSDKECFLSKAERDSFEGWGWRGGKRDGVRRWRGGPELQLEAKVIRGCKATLIYFVQAVFPCKVNCQVFNV